MTEREEAREYEGGDRLSYSIWIRHGKARSPLGTETGLSKTGRKELLEFIEDRLLVTLFAVPTPKILIRIFHSSRRRSRESAQFLRPVHGGVCAAYRLVQFLTTAIVGYTSA